MATSDNKPTTILAFLTEIHLESYYNKFIEEGYDDIEFLADVQLKDLLEIGMKKGHAKHLRKAYHELRYGGEAPDGLWSSICAVNAHAQGIDDTRTSFVVLCLLWYSFMLVVCYAILNYIYEVSLSDDINSGL